MKEPESTLFESERARQKPKLIKGRIYPLEVCPEEEIINGKYIGTIESSILAGEQGHVFVRVYNGMKEYSLFSDHNILQREGVIINSPISALRVPVFSRFSIERKVFKVSDPSILNPFFDDLNSIESNLS